MAIPLRQIIFDSKSDFRLGVTLPAIEFVIGLHIPVASRIDIVRSGCI